VVLAEWVASVALVVLAEWVASVVQVVLAEWVASVVLAATVRRLYRLEEASAKTLEAIGHTIQRIAVVHLMRTGPLQIGSGAALAVIRFRDVRPVRGNRLVGRVET
jgi:hypothetical protein